MSLTKPIEQYLFDNLLTKIHVFVYLKDIIRGEDTNGKVVSSSIHIYALVILYIVNSNIIGLFVFCL